MESIVSYFDVTSKFADNSKSILLLYKSGHKESECAFQNLQLALHEIGSISAYTADVDTVLDIHPRYGVRMIPSLLIFDNGNFKNAVIGCKSDKEYAKTMIKAFKPRKTNTKI